MWCSIVALADGLVVETLRSMAMCRSRGLAGGNARRTLDKPRLCTYY